MWKLDVEGGSGEAITGLWIQMIQENAWHIIQRAQNKRICMRSISSPDVRSFYCQPSHVASYHGSAMSVVTIRCRRSHYKEQWMNSRRRGRPRKSRKDNIKEWTGQSMSSLLCIADERDRWAVISAAVNGFVGIHERRLGVTGISYSSY